MSYSKGLEGVIAGETTISHVEGDIGRLSYRGVNINELITWPYENVVALVLTGSTDAASEVNDRLLHGELNQGERQCLAAIDPAVHPMRMMQAMIPLLNTSEPSTRVSASDSMLLNDDLQTGLAIIAKIPTLIATYRCQQTGKPDPIYKKELGYLENYLQMFNGVQASDKALDVFKVVQILQLEHSYNAGTFTALVAASTLAPVDSVLSAAAGALFGHLHGGADEAALTDAKKVGAPEHAQSFVDELLARKGLLMGMGHREYRIVDPRAAILKPLAQRICQGTQHENTYLTLDALETAFNARMQEKGKQVWANLEFYKGPVYEALGIPAHFFTATFGLSRSVGWLAHFLESRIDNRIIRPKAAYVGKLPEDD